MQKETTSILLEIVSFFLVTTDLYGEYRLLKLAEKVQVLHEKVSKRGYLNKILFFIEKSKKNRTREEKFANRFIGVIAFVSTIALIPILDFYIQNSFLSKFIAKHILIYYLLSNLLVGLMLYFGIPFSVYLLKRFIQLVLYLLAKQSFEGLLIGVGAILFIISKIIVLL